MQARNSQAAGEMPPGFQSSAFAGSYAAISICDEDPIAEPKQISAPAFQSWTNKAQPSWRELLEASWMVRSELGMSQHAWAQACVVLGQTEAVTMLAAICARHAAGDVKSLGGLMRRMVELHERGELRLDRTLFGLPRCSPRGRVAGGACTRAVKEGRK